MEVVDLSGTPEEIGYGHGRALAPLIHRHRDAWRAHLAGLGVDDPVAWTDEFVATTGFVPTADELVPDLAAEVRALADGAGVRPADAWLFQLLDESWASLRRDGRSGRAGDGLGCTSFGVIDGARSFSGQTMDLESFRNGFQAVLRIRPRDGAPRIVLTMAGCVGLLGVTAHRFAVLVNALAQVPSDPTGLPVALIVRHALSLGSVDEAARFVTTAPHASGQHYLIIGSEQLASLECSPAGIAPVNPGAARVWHTNHPLVGYVPDADDAESVARWGAVAPTMRSTGWGRRRSRELLEAPPVCRLADGRPVSTFAGVVIEQSSRPAEFWCTDGPPHAEAWTLVEW